MAGDLNREASELWNSLKPIIDKEIDARTQGVVQRRKAKVTTAPSLVTNTIGVTEPFGTEMFLPFNTNIMSASVGDFVWVEYMYGMTNAFVSMFASADDKDQYVAGNLTVGGVLDVTPRRCYASLSQEGWYRVLTFSGANANSAIGNEGFIIHFDISTTFNNNNNAAHSISLHCVNGAVRFVNEQSSCYSMPPVDKIRYNRNGSYGYVDIHYTQSYGNVVSVRFDVSCRQESQYRFAANTLLPVDPSPSGETVLTEYTFAANTEYTRYTWTPTFSGTANPSVSNVLCFYSVKNGVLYAGGRFNLASFTSGGTAAYFTLPVSLGSVDRSTETIGTMFSTTKTLQLRWDGSKVYITDAGGNYSGGLLNTGYWSFQIVAPIYN